VKTNAGLFLPWRQLRKSPGLRSQHLANFADAVEARYERPSALSASRIRLALVELNAATKYGKGTRLKRDCFRPKCNRVLAYCLHMISAQTPCVCREGKPVPTFRIMHQKPKGPLAVCPAARRAQNPFGMKALPAPVLPSYARWADAAKWESMFHVRNSPERCMRDTL
jgi:hypothetical protein